MSGSGVKPPLVAHGADNYGGVIVVVSFSLMVVSVLFAGMRVYNTVARKKGFGFDDLSFYIALAIIVPQTVAIQKAVDYGLGQHITTLSSTHISAFFKWVYVGQLLSLVVQCFAKLSIILLVVRLDSGSSTWTWCRILGVVIGIWTIFSVITVAFQCGLPDPWIQSYDRCAAHGSLYYVIISLDIVTDGFLALFFIPVVWKLQMESVTRRTVTLLFASRLSVCAVSVGQLAVLHNYVTQVDKSWGLIIPIILDELVVNLSVITAGIPSVHRFLTDLQSGQFDTHVHDHELPSVRRGSPRTPDGKIRSTSSGLKSVLTSNVSSSLSSNAKRSQHLQKSVLTSTATHRPASAPEDEKPLRLIPGSESEISTHIYSNNGGGFYAPYAVLMDGRESPDTGDEESRIDWPLSSSEVMQRTELSMSVEYVKSGENSWVQSPRG